MGKRKELLKQNISQRFYERPFTQRLPSAVCSAFTWKLGGETLKKQANLCYKQVCILPNQSNPVPEGLSQDRFCVLSGKVDSAAYPENRKPRMNRVLEYWIGRVMCPLA